MSIKKISPVADYLQLCICGLTASEAVQKYISYNTNLPVILHGDWEKNGCSENNIKNRVLAYMEILNQLKAYTKILGITIHPPYRNKISFCEFLSICNDITEAANIPVFIENRSNKKNWLSQPDEIINYAKFNYMTIDIPQLYIASNFDSEVLINALDKLCWQNVKELHMGNVKRINGRTFVARTINDGEINYQEVWKYIKNNDELITLEILGGVNVFEAQLEIVQKGLGISKELLCSIM